MMIVNQQLLKTEEVDQGGLSKTYKALSLNHSKSSGDQTEGRLLTAEIPTAAMKGATSETTEDREEDKTGQGIEM